MIKFFQITFILFLASCTNSNLFETNYSVLPSMIQEAVFGQDIIVDEDFIASQDYSFIKVSVNKRVAILSLSKISTDKVYRWISNDGVIFLTKNGRVLKTYGLKNNFELLENNTSKKSLLIQLSSPRAIFEHDIISSGYSNNDELYVEKFNNTFLNWSGENSIIFSPSSDLPIKTLQYLFPGQNPVIIEYFYR
jgi:hypothetical protein